jgi:hypothetical protein
MGIWVNLSDVLNRCNDSNDVAQAKHILKYIFPKQFGLHNVFTHITDRRETTHAFKDYTDREGEIAASFKDRDEKVYKRLGPGILPLIVKMQKLHRQCSYYALIHHYCSAGEGSGGNNMLNPLDDEVDRSKELTQGEISAILSGKSIRDIQTTDKDEDMIRHHIPQYKVWTYDIWFTAGHCICLCSHQEYHSERLFWQ